MEEFYFRISKKNLTLLLFYYLQVRDKVKYKYIFMFKVYYKNYFFKKNLFFYEKKPLATVFKPFLFS